MSNDKLIDELVETGNIPANPIAELNALKEDFINICGYSPSDAEQAAINAMEVETIIL